MRIWLIIPIARIFAACLLYAGDAPVYVGVLEHPIAPPDDPRLPSGPHVRVAFQFLNGHWSAMPHEAPDVESLAALQNFYPARLAWTVALDGKKLGAVQSRRAVAASPGVLLYKDIGLQELTPESKGPTIRDEARAFATWMGASRYRPLVVISQPNYADPDSWKPFRPTAALGRQAHAAFRAVEGQQQRNSDNAIHLQPKGYRSSRGGSLIALRLNSAGKSPAESTPGDPAPAWFLLRDRAVHWIGNGLTLLDAGDYDGDGTSELLFQKSGYNLDGYLLFHVRDQSKQEFDWSYH